MVRSYSKFKYEDLAELGIQVREKTFLDVQNIAELEPTEFLNTTLERNQKRRLRSEKAKSEFIIAPILAEMEDRNKEHFVCYSGYNFNVDAQRGLRGFCDYVLSLEPHAFNIEAPVFCIVESKNEDLESGIPQCVAEMFAAKLFNVQKGQNIPIIYGAVTFGFQWKFVRLIDDEAQVDTHIFYLVQLSKLLGALQYIIDKSVKSKP